MRADPSVAREALTGPCKGIDRAHRFRSMTDPSTDLDTWRRRLTYRSWHRGTKELDLLFGPFADACLSALDATALNQFEELLLAPDPDVYNWIVGREAPDAEYDTLVLRQIIAFHDRRHA